MKKIERLFENTIDSRMNVRYNTNTNKTYVLKEVNLMKRERKNHSQMHNTHENRNRSCSKRSAFSEKQHSTVMRHNASSVCCKKGGIMHKLFLVMVCICFVMGMLHMIHHKSVDTPIVYAEEHLSDIQYKVIEIEYGDTLWNIAKENMSPGYSDINEYIDEIKECNQLSSDRINSGNYLMIPYYEIDQKDTVIASKNK